MFRAKGADARTALVLVLAVGGCGVSPPDAPYVQLAMVDDAPELPVYLAGARAWSPLGFAFGFEASDLEPCPAYWWNSGETDCQVTITLRRWDHLHETMNTDAASDITSRAIAIDTRVTDELQLATATAHEVGHVLLFTHEHTAGGIMGGGSVVMADVDRELACRAIDICI